LTSAQQRVVILDSTQASNVIKDLVRGDVCRAEMKVMDSMLKTSVKRVKALKSANDTLMVAYKTKKLEVDALNDTIKNNEKIIKKEVRKKSMWMYISAALAVIILVK